MKHLLSHNRDIHMSMTDKTIKYSIPICIEKPHMGMFRSIEVHDNEILVRFDTVRVEAPPPKEDTIKIDREAKEVSFS